MKLYKVSSGLVRGKPLTKVQRTSPLFTEVPVVCGKAIRPYSHIVITEKQKELDKHRIGRLINSGSIIISEVDTTEEILEIVLGFSEDAKTRVLKALEEGGPEAALKALGEELSLLEVKPPQTPAEVEKVLKAAAKEAGIPEDRQEAVLEQFRKNSFGYVKADIEDMAAESGAKSIEEAEDAAVLENIEKMIEEAAVASAPETKPVDDVPSIDAAPAPVPPMVIGAPVTPPPMPAPAHSQVKKRR